mmetsp:Transcript_36791/g.97226  ORF Transcript_36791/g.97226 Transcript_36791/m.97226 type:complete len:202 (+) Transcript_36791:613-1218(+)
MRSTGRFRPSARRCSPRTAPPVCTTTRRVRPRSSTCCFATTSTTSSSIRLRSFSPRRPSLSRRAACSSRATYTTRAGSRPSSSNTPRPIAAYCRRSARRPRPRALASASLCTSSAQSCSCCSARSQTAPSFATPSHVRRCGRTSSLCRRCDWATSALFVRPWRSTLPHSPPIKTTRSSCGCGRTSSARACATSRWRTLVLP